MWMLALMAAAAPPLPIESATLPLPPELRGGASIVSIDKAGKVTTLREGKGAMVCIADRPGDEEFDARCYHRDFIPYLYHSWQLEAGGLSSEQADARIEQEIKAGTFRMKMTPSAGYRMLGPVTAITTDGTGWTEKMTRWQSIHIPNATAEDLGLVVDQKDLMPFVMASGTLWSHVMINTPPE